MCGIMGYIGDRPAKNIIYAGLQRLEYRGYDSVGIALLNKHVKLKKTVGDTSKLNVDELDSTAKIGIGHTRWATHGKPSIANAHPHTFGDITLVHNGIIENYEELKNLINADKLQSETDSEVLAALIYHYYKPKTSLMQATKKALANIDGTLGIAVLSSREPNCIVAARLGSPIIIGIGDGQNYITSDAAAIVDHTDKVIYLEDNQIAVIKKDSLELFDWKLNKQNINVENISGSKQNLGVEGYDSYLEKEIFEQPTSLANAMRGRIGKDGSIMLGGPNLTDTELSDIKQILIIGCGTSYYAGLYAKYILEEMLSIPVSVEHASEFRYRYGAYDNDTTLAIFMSQSGETADTLASLHEAKRRHIKTMGIVNTVGSSIAREVSNGGIYLHAGIESSVASTKAYSSMVVALLMFGGYMAYRTGMNMSMINKLAAELLNLPREFERTLELKPSIDKIAAKLTKYHDWFFLGRNVLYPVALEGALKLTEVSYINAHAYPSGEMKHGPIALVDNKHVSVVLLPEDELLYKKSLAAVEEIKARGGTILTISTRPKEPKSDYHIEIAHSGEHADGLIYNICLQLLTLAIATKKGLSVDRPRNLAKSVTVE